MRQADLFPISAMEHEARMRIHALVEETADRMIDEILEMGESARRSIGQRHRWLQWRMRHGRG